MSREIKFRAWSKKNKWYINFGIPAKIQDFLYGLNSKEFIDDLEIEQFTGLKDKNGVEIYEGDIDGSDDEIMVVCWIEEEAAFGLKFPDDNDYYDTSINWRGLIKIGNIHENPELLEET